MTPEFNQWWNESPVNPSNPYTQNTPAYWAWEGWCAAVKAEREACAKFCETHQVWVGQGKRGFSEWGEEEFVTGGIHQGMDYAAAIRARGNL